MNENMMNRSYEVQVEGDSLGRYTAKTFGWMFAGLLVTFIVAVGFAMTGTIFYIYSFRYWPLALLAAELGVVIYLSARIETVSYTHLYCAKISSGRNWVWNQDEGRNRFQRPATMHIRGWP